MYELMKLLRREWVVRWISVGFLIGIGLVWGVLLSLPDRRFHLVACDVGQGDAILLFFRSTQVLVDGGPDERVVDCLSEHMPFWDRELEVVVLSHPQADHMNGLTEVLKRYDVSEVVVSGAMNKTDGFFAFRKAVLDEGASIYFAKTGDEIRLEPLHLEILWPKKPLASAEVWEGKEFTQTVLGVTSTQDDVNETSVVLLAKYGDFRAILVGDIGTTTEQALLRQGVLSRVDVLKVAHHGSKYASSSVFLSLVQPQFALVSVGSNNRYGHPARDTLIRLDEVGAKILRTDKKGDVEIITDGKQIWEEE